MAAAAPGSALRRLYLSAYNWVVFVGWVQVSYRAATALLAGGHEALYAAVERPLQFAQTAAVMEAQSHFLLTSLIISWSITEIIRYSFFGMKETFGFAPYWLLWLRYSTFLVFIPIGALSEVGLILVAMPSVKTSRRYNLMMANKWNFSFNYHYELALTTAIFVPGSLYLFHYMVAKRKKVLSMGKTA